MKVSEIETGPKVLNKIMLENEILLLELFFRSALFFYHLKSYAFIWLTDDGDEFGMSGSAYNDFIESAENEKKPKRFCRLKFRDLLT